MAITVPVALFGWPFVVLVLYATMRPRTAALLAFAGATLFLPMARYDFAGLPEYGKVEAASYGVLLGILLIDFKALSRFRVSWLDVPMMVWCAAPLASSLTNGLGPYDGSSAMLGHFVTWGVPYLAGRLYFCSLEGLRVLATAVVIGGLVYVPLCLLEIRLSPRLHIWFYGFHQHSWRQSHSLGGWRPTVFMQHGLAVALWMASASLLSCWLWWSRTCQHLLSIRIGFVSAALIVTTLLCKSTGASALLFLGVFSLATVKYTRVGVVFWGLALLPVIYIGLRAPGIWDGRHLLDAVDTVHAEKQGSLRYRMETEELLVDHALKKPFFGWGAHGRNRSEKLRDARLATDGFWIIVLGQRGLVGLAAFVAVLLLPVFILFHRIPVDLWVRGPAAPCIALAVVSVLYLSDLLFNAMINPIYVLAVGGLSGLVVSKVAPFLAGRRG